MANNSAGLAQAQRLPGQKRKAERGDSGISGGADGQPEADGAWQVLALAQGVGLGVWDLSRCAPLVEGSGCHPVTAPIKRWWVDACLQHCTVAWS